MQTISLSSITKKQSYDYELIAMCWHEASHAVCALINYMKVINVSVMNKKNKSGITDYLVYDPEDVSDKLFLKMLILGELQTCYAGLIGEKIYYKEVCGSESFPMHLRIGSSCDIYAASRIINKYKLSKAGKERFDFKKKIQKEVYDILIKNWDAVRIIAHALYKKNKLDFNDLKHLLSNKSENKDFWQEKFKKIKFIQKDGILNEKEIRNLLMKDI